MSRSIRGRGMRHGWVAAAALVGTTALAGPAHAAKPGEAAASLMGIVAVVLLLVAVGVAAGAFSLTVNHIFQRRATVSFKVMCARPGWSLLTGIVITLFGMGLLALLHGVGPLQLLVLVAYLIGLMLFAIAVSVRFAARIIDPTTLDDDPPEARLAIKGGLLLLAVNVVPLLGSVLFLGILLAAVGATLLGYFSKLGGATQPAAGPAPTPTVAAGPTGPAGPSVGESPSGTTG